jgi:cytochrome b subunit of formate dehydrogenase
VDACPVVASKPEGTMFVRTSMLLENVVGDECKRCYRCVAACPQVEPALKAYVRGFRRPERAAHWVILLSYVALFCTGVLINHWGEGLPKDLRALLGIAHRVCAVALLSGPALFMALDPRHFAMALRRSRTGTPADAAWWRSSLRWLASRGREGHIKRGAFNPGQRLWYLWVLAALAVFAVTGAMKWIGADVLGKGAVRAATTVHVTVAVATDVLLLLHVWLKLLLPQWRELARGLRTLARARSDGDAVALEPARHH